MVCLPPAVGVAAPVGTGVATGVGVGRGVAVGLGVGRGVGVGGGVGAVTVTGGAIMLGLLWAVAVAVNVNAQVPAGSVRVARHVPSSGVPDTRANVTEIPPAEPSECAPPATLHDRREPSDRARPARRRPALESRPGRSPTA